jgi:hypothetical protein
MQANFSNHLLHKAFFPMATHKQIISSLMIFRIADLQHCEKNILRIISEILVYLS